MIKRVLTFILIFSFVLAQSLPISAMEVPWLPVPGSLVKLSPDFQAQLLKGIRVDGKDSLHLNFLLQDGQSPFSSEEVQRSLRYFLTALTIPEKDFWVNLSPFEKNRILPDILSDTEIGRDFLSQDYILKQVSASILYPNDTTGRKFWDTVSTLTRSSINPTEDSNNLINKVWITPGDILVKEKNGVAVIVKATLKVMLADDYLTQNTNKITASPNTVVQGRESRQGPLANVFRQLVIPQLEHEVNFGKNFVRVRQIYHALILAAWYKRRYHQGALRMYYIDQKKTAGLATEKKSIRGDIYNLYLDAYRKGAFQLIREEKDIGGDMVPRKYFAGGFDFGQILTKRMQIEPLGEEQNSSSSVLPPEPGMTTRDLEVRLEPVTVTLNAEKFILDHNHDKYWQMGNKGRNLVENANLLKDNIPPFEIISALLFDVYKTGDSQKIRDVVDAIWPKVSLYLEGGGSLAVRSAGVVNMPGILPTDKSVTTKEQVVDSILKIYASWESTEAQKYLKTSEAADALNALVIKGIFKSREEAIATGPSIIIQKEVFANRGSQSAAGVLESRNIMNGEFFMSGSYGTQMPPEKLRNGDWDARNPPKPIGLAMDKEFSSFAKDGGVYKLLQSKAEALEKYYGHAVEIEFIIDRGQLFIVQVNSQFIPPSVQMLVNMQLADDGRISRALIAIPQRRVSREVWEIKEPSNYQVLVNNGRGLAPGAVDGKLAFSLTDAIELAKSGPVILVADYSNTSDLLQLLISGHVNGLITDYGDYHMHVARIAREGYIPSISIAGDKDCTVLIQDGVKKLKIGTRIFSKGDRLALSAEDIQNQNGEMIHSGKIILPEQTEPLVERKEIVLLDLDFDISTLKERIIEEYSKRDVTILTATHALLKAYNRLNRIRGKKAMELEIATNAIHDILDQKFKSGGQFDGSREDVFIPIAMGFGDKFPFIDIQGVEDIHRFYEQMQYFVDRYKALVPDNVDYFNFNVKKKNVLPLSKDVPIEFSVKFRDSVNWDYENPALWAYVRQAIPQIYYQSFEIIPGEKGPVLRNTVFKVDHVNTAQIRVSGVADVFAGEPGRVITLKMRNGNHLQTMSDWYMLEVGDYSAFIQDKITHIKGTYPIKDRVDGKYQSPADIEELLHKMLDPKSSQIGMLENLGKLRAKGFKPEPETSIISASDGLVLKDGDVLWRWFRQGLGNYVSGEESIQALSNPNVNWSRESRFLLKILKHIFPDLIAVHRSGRADDGGLELHNKTTTWTANYYSWVVLSKAMVKALSEEIYKISRKYELNDFVRHEQRGDIIDLDGLIFLIFLESGGSEDELFNMASSLAQDDVGGIDFDLSGQDFGLKEDESLKNIPGQWNSSFSQLAGFIPLTISERKIKILNDFLK